MIRKTCNVAFLISTVVLSTGLVTAQTALTNVFQDVLPTGPDGNFFTTIQLAQRIGLAVPMSLGACVLSAPAGSVPPILPPPGAAPSAQVCPYFQPDAAITRAEAAYWVVKSVFDEDQISAFLCATGGDPSGLTPSCNGGLSASTFADLGVAGASIVNPFVGPNPALGIRGVTNAQLMRYIEVMARRGYTKGCSISVDAVARFCPNDAITRAQVSVFIIRAKMDNVFPTSLSGIPLSAPFGDNFSVIPTPFFTDVQPNDPVFGIYFNFIQKMRELGITQGTSPTTFSPGRNVTRKEVATFVVRAFFL